MQKFLRKVFLTIGAISVAVLSDFGVHAVTITDLEAPNNERITLVRVSLNRQGVKKYIEGPGCCDRFSSCCSCIFNAWGDVTDPVTGKKKYTCGIVGASLGALTECLGKSLCMTRSVERLSCLEGWPGNVCCFSGHCGWRGPDKGGCCFDDTARLEKYYVQWATLDEVTYTQVDGFTVVYEPRAQADVLLCDEMPHLFDGDENEKDDELIFRRSAADLDLEVLVYGSPAKKGDQGNFKEYHLRMGSANSAMIGMLWNKTHRLSLKQFREGKIELIPNNGISTVKFSRVYPSPEEKLPAADPLIER